MFREYLEEAARLSFSQAQKLTLQRKIDVSVPNGPTWEMWTKVKYDAFGTRAERMLKYTAESYTTIPRAEIKSSLAEWIQQWMKQYPDHMAILSNNQKARAGKDSGGSPMVNFKFWVNEHSTELYRKFMSDDYDPEVGERLRQKLPRLANGDTFTNIKVEFLNYRRHIMKRLLSMAIHEWRNDKEWIIVDKEDMLDAMLKHPFIQKYFEINVDDKLQMMINQFIAKGWGGAFHTIKFHAWNFFINRFIDNISTSSEVDDNKWRTVNGQFYIAALQHLLWLVSNAVTGFDPDLAIQEMKETISKDSGQEDGGTWYEAEDAEIGMPSFPSKMAKTLWDGFEKKLQQVNSKLKYSNADQLISKDIATLKKVLSALAALGIRKHVKVPVIFYYQTFAEPSRYGTSAKIGHSSSGTYAGTNPTSGPLDVRGALRDVGKIQSPPHIAIFRNPKDTDATIQNVLAHEIGHTIYNHLSSEQQYMVRHVASFGPYPTAYSKPNFVYSGLENPVEAHRSGNEWFCEMLAFIVQHPQVLSQYGKELEQTITKGQYSTDLDQLASKAGKEKATKDGTNSWTTAFWMLKKALTGQEQSRIQFTEKPKPGLQYLLDRLSKRTALQDKGSWENEIMRRSMRPAPPPLGHRISKKRPLKKLF